jgi:hypothetical protein
LMARRRGMLVEKWSLILCEVPVFGGKSGNALE